MILAEGHLLHFKPRVKAIGKSHKAWLECGAAPWAGKGTGGSFRKTSARLLGEQPCAGCQTGFMTV